MKKDEGLPLPQELDRRLKLGIDRLKQVRKNAEELSRIVAVIQPLLGVKRAPGFAPAAPRPRRAEKARTQEGRPPGPPPPTRSARPASSSASAAQPETGEDLPEWRKLFPALSAKVPLRK
jgi:hypothetical protein